DRHVCGYPAAEANADKIHRAQIAQEPVVEDCLVLDAADPRRRLGMSEAGVRWRVDGCVIRERIVEREPTLRALDAVEHHARRAVAAFEEMKRGASQRRVLGDVALR